MSGLEETLRSLVEDRTPHNKYLGIRLESVGPGEATCMVPPATALVGDLNAATTHGGVTAALIDVASGAAVCMALGRAQRIATLELRIDSLRSAIATHCLRARAECYKVVGMTAFVRAFAYHEDPTDPVASSQGTFVLLDE
jgi:uncharacterized protein (TIGR00369 family)